MNIRQFILVVSLLISVSLQSQTYLDLEGNLQTYREHRALWPAGMLSLEVAPDTFTYVARESEGQIRNVEKVYSLLSEASKRTLSPDDIIVVIYNNEGDQGYRHVSNSGLKKMYKKKIKQVTKNKTTELFFICPNPGAMGRLSNYVNWIQDPGGFFTKNFFNYRNLSDSPLVIGPNGHYYCCLLECSIPHVYDVVEILQQEGK